MTEQQIQKLEHLIEYQVSNWTIYTAQLHMAIDTASMTLQVLRIKESELNELMSSPTLDVSSIIDIRSKIDYFLMYVRTVLTWLYANAGYEQQCAILQQIVVRFGGEYGLE